MQLILTSDSHRGEQDDLPTYLKMHEISGHDLEWARAAYSERYMPGPREMQARFVKMHRENFTLSQLQQIVKKCEQNLLDIEEKVEDAFLDKLELKMPIVESETKISAEEQLKAELIAGMKRRGLFFDCSRLCKLCKKAGRFRRPWPRVRLQLFSGLCFGHYRGR